MNPRHYILATRQGFSVMTTFGKIDKFDSAREDWPQYEEQLGLSSPPMVSIYAGKKLAVFLTDIMAATYKLLCSLVSPSKP